MTDSRTVTTECTACGDDDVCTENYCSEGTCQTDPFCAGTDNDCGCDSCTDCNADDGWYQGTIYECCSGVETCTCQDEEFRDYSCNGTDCEFEVTDTNTIKTSCSAVDNDGDGYYACGEDCYDDNADANPDQTDYFDQDRGDGSFDYDCDGTEERLNSDLYECGTGCSGSGWDESEVPDCGEEGAIAFCSEICNTSGCSCQTGGGTITQTCR